MGMQGMQGMHSWLFLWVDKSCYMYFSYIVLSGDADGSDALIKV